MSKRAFENDIAFKTSFRDYIDHCIDKKRFPNIAGFCVFADITRETFYKQKEYYSDTYNKVRNMLEDEVLQHNTYMAQLYIKNTFGLTDKVENTNTNLNKDLDDFESVEEAKEYLRKLGIKSEI
jgi:hypothetical protein